MREELSPDLVQSLSFGLIGHTEFIDSSVPLSPGVKELESQCPCLQMGMVSGAFNYGHLVSLFLRGSLLPAFWLWVLPIFVMFHLLRVTKESEEVLYESHGRD